MPGSKKGRISGGARKEINKRRAADAVKGDIDGIVFGRVTKMLGANHVTVSIHTSHAPKELRARIPNLFARRGATPITTRDVVAIEVGPDFDVDEVVIRPGDLFDIKAILTPKQAYQLHKEGEIPSWMVESMDKSDMKDTEDQFEFDYSEVKEEDESDSDSSIQKTTTGGRKAIEDDDLDIDNI